MREDYSRMGFFEVNEWWRRRGTSADCGVLNA
jgi:hypothetical protein